MLHPASTKTHDGVDAEGRQVQIKVTTTRRGFAMRLEPERLIAFRSVARCASDLLEFLRAVLPELKAMQASVGGGAG